MALGRFAGVVAVVGLVTFTGAQLAWAETSDGSCGGASASSSANGGHHDGLGGWLSGLGHIIDSAADKVASVDWNRVGRDAWAFTKGAAIGFATGVAITAAVALAVATFPAWGTAIIVGATIVGVAMALYGGYQVYKNWGNMSEADK